MVAPRPLLNTINARELANTFADHDLAHLEDCAESVGDDADAIPPSLDGGAARTGSDCATDNNVSPRSPVPSTASSASESDDEHGATKEQESSEDQKQKDDVHAANWKGGAIRCVQVGHGDEKDQGTKVKSAPVNPSVSYLQRSR